PQELVDAIIDELYDDRSALKACALVSHKFLPRCRVHLWCTLASPIVPSPSLEMETVDLLVHRNCSVDVPVHVILLVLSFESNPDSLL
ncbi:hypothetical protein BDZ89DRAFT_925146, partial [Hymenopellis radicata]